MSDSRRDDEFEAYLKRRVKIGPRPTSFERLEPPEELDRLIIGNARRAIRQPEHVPVFRAPKWSLPLGLAATILISLSVLLDLGVRGAMQQDAARGRPAPVVDTAPVAAEPAPIETAPWPPAPLAADAEVKPVDENDARTRAGRELSARRSRRVGSENGPSEIETVTIVAQRVAMDTSLPHHYQN